MCANTWALGSVHAKDSAYVIWSTSLPVKSYVVKGHKTKPRVCTKLGTLKGDTFNESRAWGNNTTF